MALLPVHRPFLHTRMRPQNWGQITTVVKPLAISSMMHWQHQLISRRDSHHLCCQGGAQLQPLLAANMKQLKATLPLTTLTTLTVHVVHWVAITSYWAETTEWSTRSPLLTLPERSSMYRVREVLLHRLLGVIGTAILPSRRLLTL